MKKPAAAMAAALLLTACSSTSAQPARRQSASDVVATAGAVSITLAQVDDKALEQPVANFGSLKLSQALYEARRTVIEETTSPRLSFSFTLLRRISLGRTVVASGLFSFVGGHNEGRL